MSVISIVDALITPIFRVPEDPRKWALLAHWHGYVSVTGDGTGGTNTCNLRLGSGGTQICGPFALWDLKVFTWKAQTTAPSYVKLQINSNERTSASGVQNYIYDLWHNGTELLMDIHPSLFGCKFRLADDEAAGLISNLTVYGPNVNGEYLRFWARGGIYDERYLDY